MNTRVRQVTMCAALMLSAARAQVASDEAEARCAVLFEGLMAIDDVAAARARIREIEALELDLAVVTRVLRAPRAATPREVGTTERTLTLGPQRETFKVLVYVPEVEDAERPLPLWITLHGTGGRAEQPFRSMLPFARERGFILASLEEHPGRHGRGWGYTDVERDVHRDLVRFLAADLPIDRNRVHVNGWSRGGHGSWDMALRYPDLLAGIGPIIGAVPQRDFSRVPSLRGVCVDAVNGALDQTLLVDGATEAVRRMESRGYDVRHFVDPRRGHEGFGDRIAPMVAHLLGHARDPRPRVVTLATWNPDVDRAFWVTVKKLGKGVYTPGKPITISGSSSMTAAEKRAAWLAHVEKGTAFVEATVEARDRIVVDARLVSSVELRLHPELLDLDARVEIVINGRKKTVRPGPSVRTLLETAWEARDPELAAPARVTVSVR